MRIYMVKMKHILMVLVSLTALSTAFLFINAGRQSLQESAEVFAGMQAERDLPIYCVDTKERKISISFDAAWGADKTERILDILDEYEIKTTFFLVGFWVDKYPEHVKMIVDRGHEIGNHTTTHPHMSKLSAEQMKLELKTTADKIESITGQKVELFRPPYGDYSDTVVGTARDEGYYTIQWSVDSLDWQERGTQDIIDQVTKKVKPGSIVLFHNNSRDILEALPSILEYCKKEKLDVVPISQLIYKDGFTIDSSGMQRKQ